VQAASIAAWGDEPTWWPTAPSTAPKFAQVTPMLASVLDVALPDAGFYLWAGGIAGSDTDFARDLLAQYNVTVLPGSYLAREASGSNPGTGPHPDGAGGRNRRMPGSRAAHRPICPA
jgi:N-succinyldiaminopimelate aminotransferase